MGKRDESANVAGGRLPPYVPRLWSISLRARGAGVMEVKIDFQSDEPSDSAGMGAVSHCGLTVARCISSMNTPCCSRRAGTTAPAARHSRETGRDSTVPESNRQELLR
jgi:hypothetical protein